LADDEAKEKANQKKAELIFHQDKRQQACGCTRSRCYVSCPVYLTHYATDAEFWHWWADTAPPNNREREVHPPGAPSFKGGSKKGRTRKKKPPKSLFVNTFLGE